MNLTYDDDTLREINENIDLLEYISRTIELEKRGEKYFAHCPLHVDMTPSLCINPNENYYHCFSCGKSGGAIGWMMDYEGLRFEEAVKKAAELAKIDLSKKHKSQTLLFLKKIKNFRESLIRPKYEHRILPDKELSKYKHEYAEEWINEGIEKETLDLFGVRIDDWNHRIVYPVYDIDGNLINIKARTRYPNYKQLRIPKYINYYEIGVMDYFQCLNITFPYIKGKNEVVIFESIKSVMKAYQWGYKNCVSAEKHNLTEEQIMLLVKMKVNIVFAYDSDISYWQDDVKCDIDKLKKITNVYVIDDINMLLGGPETKNAPVDLGRYIWEELYNSKRKVV